MTFSFPRDINSGEPRYTGEFFGSKKKTNHLKKPKKNKKKIKEMLKNKKGPIDDNLRPNGKGVLKIFPEIFSDENFSTCYVGNFSAGQIKGNGLVFNYKPVGTLYIFIF